MKVKISWTSFKKWISVESINIQSFNRSVHKRLNAVEVFDAVSETSVCFFFLFFQQITLQSSIRMFNLNCISTISNFMLINLKVCEINEVKRFCIAQTLTVITSQVQGQ